MEDFPGKNCHNSTIFGTKVRSSTCIGNCRPSLIILDQKKNVELIFPFPKNVDEQNRTCYVAQAVDWLIETVLTHVMWLLLYPLCFYLYRRCAFGLSCTDFVCPECWNFDNGASCKIDDVLLEHGRPISNIIVYYWHWSSLNYSADHGDLATLKKTLLRLDLILLQYDNDWGTSV